MNYILRLTLITLASLTCGCWAPAENSVVVYTALDREFSEPILFEFTTTSGIQVLSKFDTESTKTVGLANAIIAESDRPRCDVFWNNEILNTLRLEKDGLLDVYYPAHADDFPKSFRSPNGNWHGFAARARVLIVNTNLLNEADYPASIHDLADPEWKDRAGIAKPLFGTTATHAACLFAVWGESKAKDYFLAVRDNARIESGNKQVALSVARGDLAFGLTDTDDAIIEKEKGMPVDIVYPDQQENGLGTLFIPNTLALIKGSKNSEHAKKLVDYLLTPNVEITLAKGRSAQIPLNTTVEFEPRVATPKTVTAMEIDFAIAADQWDVAAKFLKEEFMRSK